MTEGSMFAVEAGRVFKLFASCQVVRGGAFSAIYDLDRRRLYRFQSAYFPLFALAASKTGLPLDDVNDLEPAAKQRAFEALQYMSEHEVGQVFDAETAELLAPLPDGWSSPQSLLNAVVDVADDLPDWAKIIPELNALQCKSLQIRSFSPLITPGRLSDALEQIRGTCLSNVEAVVRWAPEWESVDWEALFERFPNLLLVRIHAAPRRERRDGQTDPSLGNRIVLFQAAPIDGPEACGGISEGTLAAPSVRLFSELKRHNGCLNRKVSIRADGEICNCPSMKAGFGKDLGRLGEIVASEAFQRPWNLHKDAIEVCKGCEFRYVCTDCRAYLGADDSRRKPARCAYDPSTGRWADERRAPPAPLN